MQFEKEAEMSCLITIILVFFSRIVMVFWWFTDREVFTLAFKNWTLPVTLPIPEWIWPLLGFIFLPITTMAYLFLFPGGIIGYEWILLGIAFLIDMTGHGGSYRHRHRVSRPRRRQTI